MVEITRLGSSKILQQIRCNMSCSLDAFGVSIVMMKLDILLVLEMHVAVVYDWSTRHHFKSQKSPTCFRSCDVPNVTILLNIVDGGADLRPGKRRVSCDILVNALCNTG